MVNAGTAKIEVLLDFAQLCNLSLKDREIQRASFAGPLT